MKGPLLCMLSVTALLAHGVSAQSITGAWQGVLPQAQADDERVIVRIREDGRGGLSATMLFADRRGLAYPANPVRRADDSVTIEIRRLGRTFVGRLTADGNTIEGGITPSGGLGFPASMSLGRATPETAWTLPPAPRPMAADVDPQFATATVGPGGRARQGFAMHMAGQFQSAGTSLAALIRIAWRVHDRQIEGGPEWMRSEAFNIIARSPAGAGEPSQAQLRAMIRKLIADRFALELHTETRSLPVYTIGVVETGHLLEPAIDPSFVPSPPLPGAWNAMNVSMADVAALLSVYALDRPVLDRTGLEGRYDFTLLWYPDEARFAGGRVGEARKRLAPVIENAPDLPTAMREQLGLSLDAATESVDVLVIDRAERPSSD